MTRPQDQRGRNELFERLWLYRWAYGHRSRYDSEPIMPIAATIAYSRWLMSHPALRQPSGMVPDPRPDRSHPASRRDRSG